MQRIVMHVLLPAIAPAAVVALYFTPLTVIDCVTRGLLALGIVLVSLVAGIVTGLRALGTRHEAASVWWIGTTGILALPALLVLGPLG